MKKLIFFLVIFLISQMIFSQEKNWQGSAIRGEDKDFDNEKGLFALSKNLPVGKKFLVKNFSNDKTVELTVTGKIREDGILLLLSPQASSKLDIEGYLPMQVQATESNMIGSYDSDDILEAPLKKDKLDKESEILVDIDNPISLSDADKKIAKEEKPKLKEAVQNLEEEPKREDNSTAFALDEKNDSLSDEQSDMEYKKKISLIPASYKGPTNYQISNNELVNDLNITEDIPYNKYYIQHGSFRNLASLERAVSQLEGYNVVVYKFKMDNVDMYRTLVGPYKDHNDAEKELAKIHEQGYYDSYIRKGYDIAKK